MENNKVRVLVVESEEGDLLFRADDETALKRFAEYLDYNADPGNHEKISYKAITQEEWAEAERLGGEMA